jgi:hypothetical protein
MKIKLGKNSKEPDNDAGILYIVHFHIDDKDLIKIGVTGRTIEDRVSEILVSIFKTYRFFPYALPKRFRKTSDAYEKEAILHKHFKSRNYKTSKPFSGSTEFFDVPLDEVVKVYENLLDDKPLDEGL